MKRIERVHRFQRQRVGKPIPGIPYLRLETAIHLAVKESAGAFGAPYVVVEMLHMTQQTWVVVEAARYIKDWPDDNLRGRHHILLLEIKATDPERKPDD